MMNKVKSNETATLSKPLIGMPLGLIQTWKILMMHEIVIPYKSRENPQQSNDPLWARTWQQWEGQTKFQEETSSRIRLQEGQPFFFLFLLKKSPHDSEACHIHSSLHNCSWLGFSMWSLVLSGAVQVCPSTVGLTGNSKLAVSVAISAVLMDYVSFDIISWNKTWKNGWIDG